MCCQDKWRLGLSQALEALFPRQSAPRVAGTRESQPLVPPFLSSPLLNADSPARPIRCSANTPACRTTCLYLEFKYPATLSHVLPCGIARRLSRRRGGRQRLMPIRDRGSGSECFRSTHHEASSAVGPPLCISPSFQAAQRSRPVAAPVRPDAAFQLHIKGSIPLPFMLGRICHCQSPAANFSRCFDLRNGLCEAKPRISHGNPSSNVQCWLFSRTSD